MHCGIRSTSLLPTIYSVDQVSESENRTGRFIRKDIEGLRAIAVLLVVLFHAGVPFLKGGYVGVDVFYVISGFVITSSLLRDIDSGRKHILRRFYGRRIRRLLPAATLVIVSTGIAASVLIAPINLGATGKDFLSSALFYSNWHFAAEANDYMAMPVGASPVLHFWSLSVEEQFYAIWPSLMLVIVWSAANLRRPERNGSGNRIRDSRGILFPAVAVVAVASFAFSAVNSGSESPWAFFGLHTRFWELAIGAMLALSTPALRNIKQRIRWLCSLAGSICVLASAFLFDEATTFPGIAAALPVLGTGALIVAGSVQQLSDKPLNLIERMLGSPIFQYVGARSYSWYLWHWPMLIFAGLIATDGASETSGSHFVGSGSVAPPFAAICAVVASAVVADISYRLIENPIRRSAALSEKVHRSYALGVALVALGAGIALAIGTQAPDGTHKGRMDPAGNGRLPLEQQLSAIRGGNGYDTYGGCWSRKYDKELVRPCLFGDTGADRSIVLFGDSHMAMWMPAFDHFGKEHSLGVRMWTRDGCGWSRQKARCDIWQSDVINEIHRTGPHEAIVLSQQSVPLSPGSSTSEGPDAADVKRRASDNAARIFRKLSGTTKTVIILRDIPIAPFDPPTCLSNNMVDHQSCSFSPDARKTWGHIEDDAAKQVAALRVPSVQVVVIDTEGIVCTGFKGRCEAVSGAGTLSYADVSHITPQRAVEVSTSLADQLDPFLAN